MDFLHFCPSSFPTWDTHLPVTWITPVRPEKVEREERGRAEERSEPEMEPVKVPSHHRKSRASREGENPQEAVKP